MEHHKTTTHEILGHYKYCVFSHYGTNPFKFDPCRNCNGLDNVCENYIPVKVQSPQPPHNSAADTILYADTLEEEKQLIRSAYQQIIARNEEVILRNKKFLSAVRKANDGGCV